MEKGKSKPHFDAGGAAMKGNTKTFNPNFHAKLYRRRIQKEQQQAAKKMQQESKENPHELAERHRKVSKEWWNPKKEK